MDEDEMTALRCVSPATSSSSGVSSAAENVVERLPQDVLVDATNEDSRPGNWFFDFKRVIIVDVEKGDQVVNDEEDDVLVKLAPICGLRQNCRACCKAKDKNSDVIPCGIVDEDVGKRPNRIFGELGELFRLFLTFLYKHENDELRNSDQRLAVLFGNSSNRPPASIIQLYVSTMKQIKYVSIDISNFSNA